MQKESYKKMLPFSCNNFLTKKGRFEWSGMLGKILKSSLYSLEFRPLASRCKIIMQKYLTVSYSNFLNDLGFLKWAWLYHAPLWLQPNIKLAFSNSPYLCRRTEKIILKKC